LHSASLRTKPVHGTSRADRLVLPLLRGARRGTSENELLRFGSIARCAQQTRPGWRCRSSPLRSSWSATRMESFRPCSAAYGRIRINEREPEQGTAGAS
jgi:hypothetical protein